MTIAADDLDLVVLLDDGLQPAGTAPRLEVHGPHTPLHLAFSCYVSRDDGRVLMTRRALGKLTWPGVWTNACCGHPRPGEPVEHAVRRRVGEELGIELADVRPVLPDFRYRAEDASGVVENELCPVFVARVVGELRPDPAEVMDHTWVAWPDLVAAVAHTPWAFSPWAVEQITGIGDIGTR